MNDFGFWLKKFLTFSVYPLPVILVLLFVGLWLLLWTKNLARAKILLTLATVWLLVCSTPYLPSNVLHSLEWQYRKLGVREQILASYPDAETSVPYIVVLGAGCDNTPDPTLPALSRLPTYGLRRVVEAVRLHEYFPATKIIMAGGGGEAETMARAAEAMGVAAQDLLLENRSKDTEDQAWMVKPFVQDQRFFLITSAWHMPRSAGLFRKQKNHFIADPVDYLTSLRPSYKFFPISYWNLPNTNYLVDSELSIKEYLGIGVAKLKGVFTD